MSYGYDESADETPSDPHWGRELDGPEGREDLSPGPETPPAASSAPLDQRNPLEGINFDELRENPILLAKVTAYLQENHLHIPLLTPDIDEMARMKKETPELYKAYVEALRAQTRADEIARTAPYTEPGRVVFRGQIAGLVAVIAVLVFAGYLAFIGHPIAGSVIAGIDIVALAAVFAGTRSEDSDASETPQ